MLLGRRADRGRVLVLDHDHLCVGAARHVASARALDGLDGIDGAHARPRAHVPLVALDDGHVGAKDRVVAVNLRPVRVEQQLRRRAHHRARVVAQCRHRARRGKRREQPCALASAPVPLTLRGGHVVQRAVGRRERLAPHHRRHAVVKRRLVHHGRLGPARSRARLLRALRVRRRRRRWRGWRR